MNEFEKVCKEIEDYGNRAYEKGQLDILCKIRGELHSEITLLETGQTGNKLVAYGMKQALEVIDKYIEMGCRDTPQADCNTCDKAVRDRIGVIGCAKFDSKPKMICEECIHNAICYRRDYITSDYANKCGDYIGKYTGGE